MRVDEQRQSDMPAKRLRPVAEPKRKLWREKKRPDENVQAKINHRGQMALPDEKLQKRRVEDSLLLLGESFTFSILILIQSSTVFAHLYFFANGGSRCAVCAKMHTVLCG